MNKKKIFIWSLYDFANSIVMIAFFLYFSQWLVIDRGISDFWFNATLAISSLLFLLVGPVLGSIADKTGNKTSGIRITTILTAILYLITGLITVFIPEYDILAAFFFTIASSVYLLSFIYYNSFLKDIAPAEKNGLVSGWGLVGNYLGQITAILISLPFATGVITLWGTPGRSQVFIPATIIFFLFALPLLISFKKDSRIPLVVHINVLDEYKNVWRALVNLLKIPNLGRFFLAYFLFNDAVLTAGNNFPIYLERVFGTDDTIKSYILLGMMITSAISCPISGWIADKIGFKKTLIGILIGWIVMFPLLAFANSVIFVVFVAVITGLLFGSVWTVTRAMVIKFTPQSSLNQSFTYFTLMERFATFIGPISWGLIVALAPHSEAFNYRAAAFSMTIFVVVGLLIIRKLPGDTKEL
ncbi:MAG: MFS transporter [Candidatus Paceibacterota bacterium]|jgi:UMF1 family MFS transporter